MLYSALHGQHRPHVNINVTELELHRATIINDRYLTNVSLNYRRGVRPKPTKKTNIHSTNEKGALFLDPRRVTTTECDQKEENMANEIIDLGVALSKAPEMKAEKKTDGESAWSIKKRTMEEKGYTYTPIWLKEDAVNVLKAMAKKLGKRYEEILTAVLESEKNYKVFADALANAKAKK